MLNAHKNELPLVIRTERGLNYTRQCYLTVSIHAPYTWVKLHKVTIDDDKPFAIGVHCKHKVNSL